MPNEIDSLISQISKFLIKVLLLEISASETVEIIRTKKTIFQREVFQMFLIAN